MFPSEQSLSMSIDPILKPPDTIDNKVAAGLMAEPLFPLWPIESISPELRARIRPLPESPLNLLGLGFNENPFFSVTHY